ncbi:MAG: hypothetical protein AAB347_02415 [Bacteroidota bacterium]
MRIAFFIILMFSSISIIFAQKGKIEIEGAVSFQTAQNIYVKFLSAKGIRTGDKIFIRKNDLLVEVLSVENASSVSCVGKPVGSEKLKVGDKVIALVTKEDAVAVQEMQKEQANQVVADSSKSLNLKSNPTPVFRKERIDGRVQISSYTNLSSLQPANNRLRYIFSMNASNISNSRFSLDTYISFAHKLNDWTPVKDNIFNALKIYDLNLKYEANDKTIIWLGRKVNPKISSLGAIDGVQFEMNFDHFFWGAVGGFRPDYVDYSFNGKLLEYGAFVGHAIKNDNGVMQTSLAGFNQTNSGNTDRRFVYFQHDNSLFKNLNLFVSSEIDLYKMVNGIPSNELTLTSLYLMLNYRISKRLSVSSSYDNRKNIIYYETYKNYIDVMLADATRQGVQLRINYRPINYMSVGVSASYWDSAGDSKPTKNFSGIFNYSQLTSLKISTTLTANVLKTSYVDGVVYGIRFDKDFMNGKMNWGVNYRFVDYNYLLSSGKLIEHIG